ncbi:MAG: CBS domain-containing protein [Deltaproteobacteria bacterium]|nr:CBS domain-containing protein [Deltaproteobacteria bacterium]MBW2361694.1 CBS domain-containing protein [Deltaproteobacteria bacterium]
MPTAADVMTRDVLSVRPDMTITEFDELLIEARISGAPVLEDGKLVGIVSRADVVRALYKEQVEANRVSDFYTSPFPIPIPALEHLARDSRQIADHMTKLQVRDVMTPAPGRVQPDTDVREVARLMSSEGFHRVPVMQGDQLLGIVSAIDLLRLMGERGLGDG